MATANRFLSPALALCAGVSLSLIAAPAFAEGPAFKVDPNWPKQLPNNWIIGQIGGMNVDAQDHIWVFQRPRSLRDVDLAKTKNAKCCQAAPSVIEFDADGNVVSSWGGPGYNPDWPDKIGRASCRERV